MIKFARKDKSSLYECTLNGVRYMIKDALDSDGNIVYFLAKQTADFSEAFYEDLDAYVYAKTGKRFDDRKLLDHEFYILTEPIYDQYETYELRLVPRTFVLLRDGIVREVCLSQYKKVGETYYTERDCIADAVEYLESL